MVVHGMFQDAPDSQWKLYIDGAQLPSQHATYVVPDLNFEASNFAATSGCGTLRIRKRLNVPREA